jgi:hypothetical protein
MNDDPRIKLLMDSVEKLTDILQGLIEKSQKETQQRLEICMEIMGYVVRLKNAHAALARRIANSPGIFDDEDSKQQFLSEVAQLESECERLESIIAKAKEPDEQPPGQLLSSSPT